MLRRVPAAFFDVIERQDITSAAEVLRALTFVYQSLPNSPRALVFEPNDENRYLLMFTTTYCDDQGTISLAKLRSDAHPSKSAEAVGMTGEVPYLALVKAQQELDAILNDGNAENDTVRDYALAVRDAWIDWLKEEAQ